MEALTGPSFKPLESGTDEIRTLKLVLLLTLLSLRRIGDLQALLVSPACLDLKDCIVKDLKSTVLASASNQFFVCFGG